MVQVTWFMVIFLARIISGAIIQDETDPSQAVDERVPEEAIGQVFGEFFKSLSRYVYL